MFNSIYVGLLATESPCTFLDVRTDGIASLRYFKEIVLVSFINLIHLIGCVILPMSLQGYMVIETLWYS